MNLRNVKLICHREIRDQLRDRRTLFMVAILPMLMYPLLGTSFFQLSQFMRQHTGKVLVVGASQLDQGETPPLFEKDRFHQDLYDQGEDKKRLAIQLSDTAPSSAIPEAQDQLADGSVDVFLLFPDGFANQLASLRESESASSSEVPRPLVLFNSAREQSQVAQMRVERLLRRWQQEIAKSNLSARDVPIEAVQPILVQRQDVAKEGARDARLWAKLLPFVAFIWALTGAFYPAIDLCAGEKERGTLETLLASPARRSEVVAGKLLTVMTFSFCTALLNIIGLMVTARLVISQLATLGPGESMAISPPSTVALLWLVVAMIPMVALFSALSLAFASYARSTKEGQYYYMPLFLGTMPLMMLPMSPGVELNLGNSLVPVMGLVLLLRSVLEGQTAMALAYAPPAIITTLVCCWLATRWAISQFSQESVLFRDSERFDLRSWFVSTFRRREETVSAPAAMACIVAIFVAQFLYQQILVAWPPAEVTFGYFASTILGGQLLCIAAPAFIVVALWSRDWRKSLLLDQAPRWSTLALVAGLAVALHPVGQWLNLWIQKTYPLSDQVRLEAESLMSFLGESPSIFVTLGLLSLLPALCEEIAFRGVLLGGLRKSIGSAAAIVISAALFGAVHTLLQQSLAAAPLGALIALIAIRTKSLYACIVFHAIYNGLHLLSDHFQGTIQQKAASWGIEWMVFHEFATEQLCYSPAIAILGSVVALALVRVIGNKKSGMPQIA